MSCSCCGLSPCIEAEPRGSKPCVRCGAYRGHMWPCRDDDDEIGLEAREHADLARTFAGHARDFRAQGLRNAAETSARAAREERALKRECYRARALMRVVLEELGELSD